MVQLPSARLDGSFAALADAARRGVVEQLARAEASIPELADRFYMTLADTKTPVGVSERRPFELEERADGRESG